MVASSARGLLPQLHGQRKLQIPTSLPMAGKSGDSLFGGALFR
jgi:hypothetical protein